MLDKIKILIVYWVFNAASLLQVEMRHSKWCNFLNLTRETKKKAITIGWEKEVLHQRCQNVVVVFVSLLKSPVTTSWYCRYTVLSKIRCDYSIRMWGDGEGLEETQERMWVCEDGKDYWVISLWCFFLFFFPPLMWPMTNSPPRFFTWSLRVQHFIIYTYINKSIYHCVSLFMAS